MNKFESWRIIKTNKILSPRRKDAGKTKEYLVVILSEAEG